MKPGRILYIADARDLEDRAEHVQKVLAAVLGYVSEIVDDTSYVAPVGLVDGKYLMGRISDLRRCRRRDRQRRGRPCGGEGLTMPRPKNGYANSAGQPVPRHR